MRRFLSALVLLVAVGCAKPSYHVVFRPVALREAPVTRLHLDRLGDLYPAVETDTARLVQEAGSSIRRYYELASATGDSTWASLLRTYGVAEQGFPAAWPALQDSVRARTVRSATPAGSLEPVTVLVHGFNNTQGEAEEAFAVTRRVIADRYGATMSPRYLEVYWDGHTGAGSNARARSAWKNAQHNVYDVGLSLRRVIATIPREVPVRILTHSLGGKVAAVALWNTDSSLDRRRVDPEWLLRYQERMRDTTTYRRPEHLDVRLAMIVPAMPGNVISDLDSAENRGIPGALPARVIVARNRRDEAVGKHFKGLGGLLSTAWAGSTTLGARPGEFEDHARVLTGPDGDLAFCIDFSNTAVAPRAHAWTTYMHREATPELLDLLFLPGTEPPAHSARCRPSPERAG